MKKVYFFFIVHIFISILPTLSFTQTHQVNVRCGTPNLEEIAVNDPTQFQIITDLENRIAAMRNNKYSSLSSTDTITLPVVIHIIYQNKDSSENISDQQAISQIAVLILK